MPFFILYNYILNMSNTRYLIVDSRDRDNITDSTSNFTLTLPVTLSNINYVKLKRFALCHKVYNISSEYNNNAFSYNEGAGNITFNISNGNYTPDQLAVNVQNGLNGTTSNSYVYNVVYSQTTFKYTVLCSGNFSINVCTLGKFMGFTAASSLSTNAVSDSVALFDDVQYLLFDVSCFGSSLKTSKNINSTFLVPFSASETELAGLPEQIFCYTTPFTMQQFNCIVKNRDGTVAQLNNTDFYALFELGYSAN
jgi:hypothetical protein